MKGTLPFIDQGHLRCAAVECKRELDRVLRLHRPDHVQLYEEPLRDRLQDLDAAGAHLVVSVSLVDCALAARSTFERSLHAGVLRMSAAGES
jgi:hypothetical protein